ncbi:hypothetical protein SLEP1_g27206 [Rubroshorea leprosula]|uniref:Uncharacterized protein n=1 Tax=Rubroshorea leprosula TaxID=152421 RepID=A0AAV5JPH6_9ROSI|nr:hypothetical protein SLEP1_g27206 [Rubroshorea leprosula]
MLHRAVFILKNVLQGVPLDAQLQHTRSRACSSVKNTVLNACVCLPEHMETSSIALAITTGGPKCP